MTDNLTPAAPARFYGFARTRTIPEYLATLKSLGADTPSSGATIVDIPAAGEVQPQQSEPSAEPEVSQEIGGSAPNSIVLASKDAGDVGPTNANSAAPATIEVAAPRVKSQPRKKSHPKKKKKTCPPPPKRLSRLELHQAHCSICGYEDQDEIDEAFVSWEHVGQIARDYDIDRRAIYRHAHATGLYAKRDCNVRRALGRIIHEADRVTATADSVVRSIKMLTHVNAHGDWVQPPTHVIFSTATARPAAATAAKRSDTPCKVKKRLNH